jgi:hypothetical protein
VSHISYNGNLYRCVIDTNGTYAYTSNSASLTVTPPPGTTGNINGDANVCYQKSGVSYSISAVSNATSYIWTVPSGASIVSGQGSRSIIVNFGSNSGNITVTPSNTCFAGTTKSKSVTVESQMTNPVVGSNQNICYNTAPSSITITSVPTGGGGSYSYQWQQSTNGTSGWSDISSATASSYQPPSLTSDKYYRVEATSQYGCGPVYSNAVHINVYSDLSAGTIGSNQTICYNTSASAISFSVSPSGGGNSYSYQWYKSTNGSTWSLMTGETSNTLNPGSLTANTYYRCLVTSNMSCGSKYTNSVLKTVIPQLGSIGNISGDNTICYGETGKTYSISSVSNATNYVWSVPSGASITSGQGTTSITVNYGSATSGNISVYAENSCFNTTTKTLTPTITPQVSNVGSISGDNTICYGETGKTYSISSVTGATNYVWSVPTGASIASGQGTTSISVNYGTASSGSISVRAENTCFNKTNSLNLTITPQVGTTGNIGGKTHVCYQALGEGYSISSVSGATSYDWEVPTGATNVGNSTSNSISVNFGTSSGDITVTPKNSCFSGTKKTITVTVEGNMTSPVIGNAQSICYNTAPAQIAMSIAPTGGGGSYSYQWQESNNGTSGWSDIGSATSTFYNPPSLTADRYFRLEATSQYNCGPVYSNVIKITVFNNFLSGSVGNPDSICYNAASPSITFSSNPSGADGNYSYQWQESNDNSSWSDLNGQTSSSLSPGNLTQDKFYQCKVTSDYGCGTKTTNSVKIIVYPIFSEGVIGDPDSICYNTSSPSIGFNTSPSGGNSWYEYQWYSMPKGGSWSAISGANNASYSPGSLSQTTYFKLFVNTQSSYGKLCGADTTNTIRIKVWDDVQAGVIDSSQNICYNSAPALLRQITNPNGGGGYSITNNYNYQWQVSTNGTSGWSDISGQTATTYQGGSLTSDRYYRLETRSKNNCGPKYSNSLQINVYNPLSAGTIGDPDSICYNAASPTIDFSANPSGAAGYYRYQWQVSNDNSSWSDLTGEKATTLSPGNLTQDKYYQCNVTSHYGCGTQTTNSIRILVYPNFNEGIIGDPDSICYQTNSPSLGFNTNPSGGNSWYQYQWYRMPKGGSWSAISGANNTTYSPGSLSQTTYFKLFVNTQSSYGKLCGADTTNTIRIKVWDDVQAGVIDSSQNICYSSAPALLRQISNPNGGGGYTITNNYNYQWQESSNGTSGWSNIASQTNTTFQEGNLADDKYYRLETTSKNNCGPKYSNVLQIHVYDPLDAGIIGDPDSICYNASSPVISFNSNPTGSGGFFRYQWQESNNNTNWSNMAGRTNKTLSPGNLTQDKYYRCTVTSFYGCGNETTNSVKIQVYPDFNPGIIGNADSICFHDADTALKFIAGSRPSGSNGAYAYQWYKMPKGGSWSLISGATSDTFFTDTLETTTYYKLLVSTVSSYNKYCGADTTNTIRVKVWDEISSGSIGNEQFICYDTVPKALFITNNPDGGGGYKDTSNYIYQWQVSTTGTGSWNDINNATYTVLQPNGLQNTRFYRLKVTSKNNCWEKRTSPVRVFVHPEMILGQLANVDDSTICYNWDASEIYFNPKTVGADGNFSYAWEVSDNGNPGTWTTMSGETGMTLSPGKLKSTKYYRALVTSDFGCGTMITDSVVSIVRDKVLPGSIEIIDTACFSYRPGDLPPHTIPPAVSKISDPSGGLNNFTFQWEKSLDTTLGFTDISGQTNSEKYEYNKHYQKTFYRLRYMDVCDTVWSNLHTIIVNPLPDSITFSGPDVLCKNSTDAYYHINNVNSDYNYFWEVKGGTAISDDRKYSFMVKWDDAVSNDSIILTQVNKTTGCPRRQVYPINLVDYSAPDQATLIHKPGSNILFTLDTNYYTTEFNLTPKYVWGYSKKSPLLADPVRVDEFGAFYCDYLDKSGHTLDFDNNFYWLNTWLIYKDNSDNVLASCMSTSYYGDSPFSDVAEEFAENEEIDILLFPNPAKSYINVSINDDKVNDYVIILRDITGKVVEERIVRNSSNVFEKFNLFDFDSGIYFIDVIKNQKDREISKFIIR